MVTIALCRNQMLNKPSGLKIGYKKQAVKAKKEILKTFIIKDLIVCCSQGYIVTANC